MTKIDDGGPAFPVIPPLDASGSSASGYPYPDQGMSLRDWFAGRALAGLCANPGGPYQANEHDGWQIVNCMPINVAEEAYYLADAMLEARKK